MTQLMRPPSWQCPPQDDCGCGDQWGNIQQCWNEIEQLKLFLSEIIGSMEAIPSTSIGAGPPTNPQRGMLWYNNSTDQLMVYDGSNWIPVTTEGTGGGTSLGVTDGSNAQAGQVGEFITGSSQFSNPGYPNIMDTSVSPLIIPAGDWDITATMFLDPMDGVDSMSFKLNPVPQGISNDMYNAAWTEGDAPVAVASHMVSIARGSFSIPTTLTFAININQHYTTELTAGLMTTLRIEARRMR